jgi:hypothetical protein
MTIRSISLTLCGRRQERDRSLGHGSCSANCRLRLAHYSADTAWISILAPNVFVWSSVQEIDERREVIPEAEVRFEVFMNGGPRYLPVLGHACFVLELFPLEGH